MRHTLLILFILMICNVGCVTEAEYSPDGKISLNLIRPYESLMDTLTLSGNDKYAMIALLSIGDSAKNQNFLFAITRMRGDEVMTIEDAFNNYVKDITPIFTNIVEANSYMKDGKTSKKVRNIMFYFMENNNSNTLYELKGSITTEYFNYGLECMEKIALSVKL